MKLLINKLERRRCIDYIHGLKKTFGQFNVKVLDNISLNDGEFYAIHPNKLDFERTYDFEVGGIYKPDVDFIVENKNSSDMIKVSNYGEEIILNFIRYYLNSISNSYLLLEDNLSSSTDPWLETYNAEYYLIKDTIVYILNKNNDSELEKYYNYASHYPCMSILTKNSSLTNIKPKTKVPNSIQEDMINNIELLFLEIYDGESFLIWINERAGQYHTVLKNEIDRYNII